MNQIWVSENICGDFFPIKSHRHHNGNIQPNRCYLLCLVRAVALVDPQDALEQLLVRSSRSGFFSRKIAGRFSTFINEPLSVIELSCCHSKPSHFLNWLRKLWWTRWKVSFPFKIENLWMHFSHGSYAKSVWDET